MSTSKRQSILPRVQSGPRAPVNFSSGVTIAESAILTGTHTINIGFESVIHPRAKLDSANGRITMGRKCIVHERTNVGAISADPKITDSREGGVVMGDYVTVEVGAVIESGGTIIGDGCTVAVGSRVGKGAKLGKHCILTPRSVIQPGEAVPDFTVVFSNGARRQDKRGATDLTKKAHTRHIEVLRKLIPSNRAKFEQQ
ncbi:trimeric LpxA-like protein [Poronia punctata]|nr:trimeric LpxA-like protein [Poronia punctata]